MKCDLPGCDHKEVCDEPETLEDTLALVGKPCPLCGSNLMTEQDARDWFEIVRPRAKAFEAMLRAVADKAGVDLDALELDREAGSEERSPLCIGCHGGKLNISATVPMRRDDDHD